VPAARSWWGTPSTKSREPHRPMEQQSAVKLGRYKCAHCDDNFHKKDHLVRHERRRKRRVLFVELSMLFFLTRCISRHRNETVCLSRLQSRVFSHRCSWATPPSAQGEGRARRRASDRGQEVQGFYGARERTRSCGRSRRRDPRKSFSAPNSHSQRQRRPLRRLVASFSVVFKAPLHCRARQTCSRRFCCLCCRESVHKLDPACTRHRPRL
jgi:hypothetical protein